MPETLRALQALNPRLSDGLVKPLLEFFQVARDVTNGDLDLNIILLVIAIRTVEHPDFRRMSREERFGEDRVFPTRGVNIRSIAESSNMPRETVRRKVAELVDRGWIVRQGADLHYTSRAFRENCAVREAMERLAAHYYEIMRDELLKQPPADLS